MESIPREPLRGVDRTESRYNWRILKDSGLEPCCSDCKAGGTRFCGRSDIHASSVCMWAISS